MDKIDKDYSEYCDKIDKGNSLIEDAIMVYSTLDGIVPIPELEIKMSKEDFILKAYKDYTETKIIKNDDGSETHISPAGHYNHITLEEFKNKQIDLEAGMIWVPWVPLTVSTTINGEVVWYKNKWKNLLLKIKFLFIKPKYLKRLKNYQTKPINPKFYGKLEFKKDI
jgi:hypothetical protein